jgi:hypothetical protein
MENYYSKGTLKLPEVDFNASTGMLSFSGNSLQGSDPMFLEVYNPIFSWLEHYALSPAPKTTMNVKFGVFCTCTSKELLQIFSILNKIYLAGNSVAVNWYYADDDVYMEEDGLEYSELVEVPFKLIAYKSED